MNELLSKTTLLQECDQYIEYPVENAVILVNPLVVNWVTLTIDEWKLYHNLLNGSSDDESARHILMRLIVNKMVRFKNNINEPAVVPPQINVYFAPTPHCNLRCVYCYAKAQPPATGSHVISDTAATKKLLDNALTANVNTVYFTGGEPTLRNDLFELVAHVKDKGVKASILTNGTLINENNAGLFKVFDKVKISLDASSAVINDITRGSGTFDRIVPAIRLLQKSGASVAISSVISKANLDDVPALLRFVRENLGIEQHNLSLYVSHGRGKDNAETMECTFDEVVKFRAQYIEYLISTNTQDIAVTIFQPRIQKGMIKQLCGVASSEIFIDNTGRVYPCRLFETDAHIIGDVSDKPLSEVLLDSKTHCFQSKLYVDAIPSCRSCEVKNLCGGGCRSTHACYTGDIKQSYEPLCKIIKNEIRSAILLESGFNPVTQKAL